MTISRTPPTWFGKPGNNDSRWLSSSFLHKPNILTQDRTIANPASDPDEVISLYSRTRDRLRSLDCRGTWLIDAESLWYWQDPATDFWGDLLSREVEVFFEQPYVWINPRSGAESLPEILKLPICTTATPAVPVYLGSPLHEDPKHPFHSITMQFMQSTGWTGPKAIPVLRGRYVGGTRPGQLIEPEILQSAEQAFKEIFGVVAFWSGPDDQEIEHIRTHSKQLTQGAQL